MEQITFKDIANCTGLNESKAGVAFSVPPIHEGNRHFRAFCLAELLVNRIEDDRFMWGDVVHVSRWKEDDVLVEVRFPSCTQTFPIIIPSDAIAGHKDNIVLQIRRLKNELTDQLHVWSKISKKGTLKIDTNELIKQMNSNKKKQYHR